MLRETRFSAYVSGKNNSTSTPDILSQFPSLSPSLVPLGCRAGKRHGFTHSRWSSKNAPDAMWHSAALLSTAPFLLLLLLLASSYPVNHNREVNTTRRSNQLMSIHNSRSVPSPNHHTT